MLYGGGEVYFLIYKVAVVDDEAAVVEQLSDWLDVYGKAEGHEFIIDKFGGTTQFMKSDPEDYNIIFMDINLPHEENGMKIAKRLRENRSKAVIIFCTNYPQYAINGYEVGALNYLIKPLNKHSFENTMKRAMRVLSEMCANKIIIKTVEGKRFVNIADIVYIEVMIHNVYYHIKRGDKIITERTRGSLNEVEIMLTDMNFARCSACYLVNMAYVTGIEKNGVQIYDGQTLSLSRKYAKDFTNKIMRYMAEFGIING